MKTKNAFALVIGIFLFGCTAPPQVTPTQSVTETQTATLVPASATVEATATVTKTKVAPPPLMTNTPEPTQSKTPTMTPTIDEKQNARATVDALEEICVSFDTRPGFLSSRSSSENWAAINCNNGDDIKLIVLGHEGQQWSLDLKSFLYPSYPGWPEAILSPIIWDADEKFLYFSTSLGYSGGGNECFSGGGTYGLFQLDLFTGSVSTLLPPTDKFPGYRVVFSPNATYFAANKDGVTISNLETNESTVIDVSAVMGLSWSPNGRFLTFTTAQCGVEYVESSSVYVWDANTNQTYLLFSQDGMVLRPSSWTTNSVIRIEGETWLRDSNGSAYTIFEYDIAQGELIYSATATPRP
jgi:hypothetical protein